MVSYSKRKSISPVVATSLLIVVAVLAVVGFSKWFDSYSSGLFSGIENKGVSMLDVSLEGIIDNTLYIRSNNNISVKNIEINGKYCNISYNLSVGVNEINISSCLNNLTRNPVDVVVLFDNKILEKKIYLKDVNVIGSSSGSSSSSTELSSSLSCSIDNDSDGLISWSCAVYPMLNTTYEGDLDINDNNNSIPGTANDRCYLKDNKSSCVSNFVVDGCGTGTVLDKGTNLCWQRDMSAAGQMNWSSAISYCDNLNLGGYSDWRLPTKEELMTLTDLSRCNPAIVGGNNNIFQNVQSGYYWTFSTYGLNTADAWVVGFSYGYDGNYAKSNSTYVVCVRENS